MLVHTFSVSVSPRKQPPTTTITTITITISGGCGGCVALLFDTSVRGGAGVGEGESGCATRMERPRLAMGPLVGVLCSTGFRDRDSYF